MLRTKRVRLPFLDGHHTQVFWDFNIIFSTSDFFSMAPRQALIDALKEAEANLMFVGGTPPEQPFSLDPLSDRRDRVRRWRLWTVGIQVAFCLIIGLVGLLSVSDVAIPSLVMAVLAGTGMGLAVGVRNIVYCAKVEQLYDALIRLEEDAEAR